MKKPLLFCLSVILCTVVSYAQITINQSNIPYVGLIAIENVDTVFTGITPGNAGTNQTWNFSSLATHSKDTSMFVNPSTLAGFSSFPTANLGVQSTGNQNIFAVSNSSSFDILGLNGDFGAPVGIMSVVLNPFKRMITFPATYLTTYSGTYTFQLQFPYSSPPIDSARMSSSVSYVNNIDAWGSITTPAYSNVSSLRQNIREINTTTTYVHLTGIGWQPMGTPTVDTSFTYSWWSNTVNYTLAEIQTNGSGVVTDAKYLSAIYTGVNENISTENVIKIYPNPATTQINVSGITENCYIIIYNIEGQIVLDTFLKSNHAGINVSKFNNGMYFYNVMNLNGNSVAKGKFEVVKN